MDKTGWYSNNINFTFKYGQQNDDERPEENADVVVDKRLCICGPILYKRGQLQKYKPNHRLPKLKLAETYDCQYAHTKWIWWP